MPLPQYALRFLSGTFEGRDVVLPNNTALVIGRTDEADLEIDDPKLSRQHARISTMAGVIEVEDLKSRNGTFVNGEKIQKARLKPGDRIVIGASTIRLVPAAETAPRPSTPERGESRPKFTAPSEETQSSDADDRPLTGSLREFRLSDVLQLLASSHKTGILTARFDPSTARIYVRDGQIFNALLDEALPVSPRKVIYRALGWQRGIFEFGPLGDVQVGKEVSSTTVALLMEGMRQLDELTQLRPKIPPPGTRAEVATPLPGMLSDLAPEELTIYQLVLHHKTVQAVIDHYPGPDLEAYANLLNLVRQGYIALA